MHPPAKKVKHSKDILSELRQDVITRKWVVIATSRGKRPDEFRETKAFPEAKPCKKGSPCPSNCPFRDLSRHYHDATLAYYEGDDINNWRIIVFPNDFPAFVPIKSLHRRREGIFTLMNAVGYHEVIVLRSHCEHLYSLPLEDIHELLRAYRERYLALMDRKYINYILVMTNYGQMAGASVYHPHSQLFAVPIVSSDIQDELDGAFQYYRERHRCVYCSMVSYELRKRVRVVYENEDYVMICPFMSRTPFEMSIMPKKHTPYFERSNDRELETFAEILQVGLKKLYHGLDDPPLNFYLHTSPCDGLSYDYYHWHLKIMPRLARFAGFELGTGIEVNTVSPEDAAKFLYNVKY